MDKLIYAANVSLDGFPRTRRGLSTARCRTVHAFWNEYERHIGTSLYRRRIDETMRVRERDDW